MTSMPPTAPSAPLPAALFEVSWEICHQVTGLNTLHATKARTLVEKLGDAYIAVGPWLLSEADRELPFDDEPWHQAFAESCRQSGIPVRVGRWRVPGRPRAMLIEFSGLFGEKDDILARLWEQFRVDSISGSWDYVEPVLFGHAAGRVIEMWWEEFLAPEHRRTVVQTHEWITASALLYLRQHVPTIGTVMTCHGTVLGRTLAAAEQSPCDGLGGHSPEQLAQSHDVVAKHSLEDAGVRQADVVEALSELASREVELLHGRPADEVVLGGIDPEQLDAAADPGATAEARAAIRRLATAFFGEGVDDAVLLATSGRYEVHNKGIDLLLEALAEVNQRAGRHVVLLALVPTGNSGLRSELASRLAAGGGDGPLGGYATHHLFDDESDPIHDHCARVGLTNEPDHRVRVLHVPIHVRPGDGLFDRSYPEVIAGMHATCFPAYYEPGGLAPLESLAVGTPTVSSDYSGFGLWARAQKLGPDGGVRVLSRHRQPYADAVEGLTDLLEELLGHDLEAPELRAACRATAARLSWPAALAHDEHAWQRAAVAVDGRSRAGVLQQRKPRRPLPVQPLSEGRRPRLTPFWVSATLPEPLASLRRLARNFWWCWNPDAEELFAALSPEAWAACGRNPIALLQRAYPEDLERRGADAEYLARMRGVLARFEDYVARPPHHPLESGLALTSEHPVAYFCAEYGLHESLPIYSGGLGILAGDHLKSASDLGLPLIAVGLFYRLGYMTQQLTSTGEQIAIDVENDPQALALEVVTDDDGAPIEVTIPLPGRELRLRAWRADVGRVRLYLLDANVQGNRPEDRDVTRNLYGGDEQTRILQEIALGRGGVRLLRRLGIRPAVYHMNEGHAAFLTLERVGRLVREEGLPLEAAREIVRATTLFTTHTPVPAGHDRFSEDLMRRHFSDVASWLGMPWERFYALGSAGEEGGEFNMTMLALSLSSVCNGVSQLHAKVSRGLLHPFWPGLLQAEVPVTAITNGIHLATWTHPSVAALLGGNGGPIRPAAFEEHAQRIDRRQLWKTRSTLRSSLLHTARTRVRRSFVQRGDSPRVLEKILAGLVDDALVIGFARRFAPYKRAHLLFSDIDRLHALLSDEERPVRILFAGKAHPRDTRGKEILASIAGHARSEALLGRVVLLEDYDIELGRALVQGVDIWLNNPTRMLEASGTSGMKAAANGALNLSIGDGWWPEAHDGRNGWMIAKPTRDYDDSELQDQLDSGALYRLLEDEVVPMFFNRAGDGVPVEWIERVVHSLRTIPPRFNTDRMLQDYTRTAYEPLGRAYFELGADDRAEAKRRAQHAQVVRKAFGGLAFSSRRFFDAGKLRVGESFDARVEIDLGELRPDDVLVELVLGHALGENNLRNPVTVPLHPVGQPDGRVQAFEGGHRIERSGHYAHGLRVRPGSDPCGSLHDLVLWA